MISLDQGHTPLSCCRKPRLLPSHIVRIPAQAFLPSRLACLFRRTPPLSPALRSHIARTLVPASSFTTHVSLPKVIPNPPIAYPFLALDTHKASHSASTSLASSVSPFAHSANPSSSFPSFTTRVSLPKDTPVIPNPPIAYPFLALDTHKASHSASTLLASSVSPQIPLDAQCQEPQQVNGARFRRRNLGESRPINSCWSVFLPRPPHPLLFLHLVFGFYRSLPRCIPSSDIDGRPRPFIPPQNHRPRLHSYRRT
jgi:hypothetical protein